MSTISNDLLRIVEEANKIAREYCCFENDIVFTDKVKRPNAVYVYSEGKGFKIQTSNTKGDIASSETACNIPEARRRVERILISMSEHFPYAYYGDDDGEAFQVQYQVYKQMPAKVIPGQGDIGYEWTYVCKDVSTGKLLRIKEEVSFSVYGGVPGTADSAKKAVKNNNVPVYIDISIEREDTEALGEPIKTVSLPITIHI